MPRERSLRRAPSQPESARRFLARGERRRGFGGSDRRGSDHVDHRLVSRRSGDQYIYRGVDSLFVVELGERFSERAHAGRAQRHPPRRCAAKHRSGGWRQQGHDLHIWAVTSDIYTLSAHAVVENGGDFHQVLNGIEETLKERFNIEHTTIQLETESREEKEFKAF